MLPNLNGDLKPTKELHNYIYKCMEEVFMDVYGYLKHTECHQEAHTIRMIITLINQKIIKE